MDYSANFPVVSSTVFVATQKMYGDYLEALPKQMKAPRDLYRLTPRKSWGRERIVARLYRETKETLYKIDEGLDEMINRLPRLTFEEVKASSDKMIEAYSKMKGIHKILISVKDLLKWVNDDYLLSTILFHMKLAENTVFSLSIDEIKQGLGDTKKIEAGIKKTVEATKLNKEPLRAMFILSLEPLLIWSALYARIKGDYQYILQYEKEVLRTARAMTGIMPKKPMMMCEVV